MVYFVQEGCFAEQDEFIARAQRLYGFELLRVGADMQESTALLVREHGVRMDDDRLDAVLGMDLTLNSQGLAVWLRSRRAA